MDNTQKLILIKGTFKPDHANEILSKIFSDKIHFHEVKNFSSQIRHGKDNKVSVKRIPELKESMEKLSEIIDHAKKNKKKFVISSDVKIELIDDK